MNRVTVVGAGFAALTCVRKLRQLDADLEITVVAPQPQFVYLPGTIWIPGGLRRPEDLVIPLERFFARHGVRYRPHAATGLSEAGRVLHTDGGDVANDGLVIASGGRFLKALPGIEHAIVPCEGVPAAVAIRDRLAALEGGTIAIGFAGNPKEPAAMRGGPMFEYLFGIDRLLRRQRRSRARGSGPRRWTRCCARWRGAASVRTSATRCKASPPAASGPRAASLRRTSSCSSPA